MDFDNMKKDKDFQKWCFDTDLVGNKNWFNLENGSGDEVYIAYEAWVAGQQSKQAEVDGLKRQLALVLDAYYLTSYFESEICVNAEEALGIKDRLSDSWYLKNVKGDQS